MIQNNQSMGGASGYTSEDINSLGKRLYDLIMSGGVDEEMAQDPMQQPMAPQGLPSPQMRQSSLPSQRMTAPPPRQTGKMPMSMAPKTIGVLQQAQARFSGGQQMPPQYMPQQQAYSPQPPQMYHNLSSYNGQGFAPQQQNNMAYMTTPRFY